MAIVSPGRRAELNAGSQATFEFDRHDIKTPRVGDEVPLLVEKGRRYTVKASAKITHIKRTVYGDFEITVTRQGRLPF